MQESSLLNGWDNVGERIGGVLATYSIKLTQQQLENIIGNHESRIREVESKANQHAARLMGTETNVVGVSNRILSVEEATDALTLVTEKELFIPRVYEIDEAPEGVCQLPSLEHGSYVAGEARVASVDGGAVIVNSQEVTATVDQDGVVTFSAPFSVPAKILVNILVMLKDLPQDFLEALMSGALAVGGGVSSQVVDEIRLDVAEERITPKSIYTQASGDTVYVSWAYEDIPELDHFILERFDEDIGAWVPYDGNQGVVYR